MQNNLSERSPVEIQHSLHHTGAAQRSSVFIIIGGSCHKYNVCRDKSFVATNKHVLVATNHVFCRDKSMLAATKLLSHHNYICHDKICLSRQIFSREHVFVATSIQNCVCRDKYLSQERCCRDKIFLSRQKTCFVLINTCRDRNDTYGSSRNETLWPIIISPSPSTFAAASL